MSTAVAGRLLPPSPALQELTILIRHGHLSEVRQLLQRNDSFQWKKGDRRQSPLLIGIRTGFYSMVEVLLEASIGIEELFEAMIQALDSNRLDIIQLLHRFGADVKTIPYDAVVRSHDPKILRWFEDHDLDLITDNPVAMALKDNFRPALGTLVRCKARIPELQRQANMALRHHARKGSMKWICLLLWAGADPRAAVPGLDPRWYDEGDETALQDAVSWGHFEIVEKFKLDPKKDDLHRLLFESGLTPNKEVVAKLLMLGANPNFYEERSVVDRCMSSLSWALEENSPFRRDPQPIVEVLCLLGKYGGRWQPKEGFRHFRGALAKANPTRAIETLRKLIDAEVLTESTFKELMSTPRMKELLNSGFSGVVQLRTFAGVEERARRRSRRSRT